MNDYSEHSDPSFCERHESQCMGDWAGSRFNPLSEAYVVGGDVTAARRVVPAHHAHSDSFAAGPSTFADYSAALVLDGRFATMTFGTEYLGTSCETTLGDDQGHRLARTTIFRDDFEAPQLATGTHAASGFGATALGVLALPAHYDGAIDEESEPSPSTVLGFAWNNGRFRRQALYEPGAGAHAEVPAVALREDGGAVVMRVGSRLMLLRVSAQGQRVGAPVVLSSTRPGAPTIAWEGADLVVVWASRARASQPFRLQRLRWDPSTPPPAPAALATGDASAFAPSLSVRAGRYALAWMEGDDRHGVIRAGVSSTSVEDAIAHAVTVSATDGNARDPEIAVGERDAWVVWQEVIPTPPPSRAAPDAHARIVTLRCE